MIKKLKFNEKLSKTSMKITLELRKLKIKNLELVTIGFNLMHHTWKAMSHLS